MITSHVVLRLSSQGKEVRRTRREESSAYGQPKNGYCEFVKFYAHFIVCKRLTPSVSKSTGQNGLVILRSLRATRVR
jgi:hypothetical protein